MAFANQGRTIPRVGLRRTLRFQWRSSDREVMPRDLFCTRIIKGQLNLTVEDVFCIQWHQQATGYDVSFVSAETHQAVTARFLGWLSTVPGSAAPRCSRFCCTQMLKVLKGFSTPLHSPAEAIRADASVRVTLVPGGGDLRVKLSQYTDDTTLLLDSDECVVRALEVLRIFEGSQELGSTLANVQRPLARTIFDFLWGGRYEWVALGRMMSGLAEGGRHVPDLPLKLDTIFVASLLQDMASEVGHPASIVPGSAPPRCSRFCCTQMLKVLKGLGTPPAFPCRGHQSRRQCEGDPGSRGRGPTGETFTAQHWQMYSEGSWKGRDVAPGGLSVCQGPIKILGVQFQPMNSATVNWEGRFQRLKSRLALWKARKLTLLGKVLVLKADMLSSVLHLAYVFPLPVAIRRPLARTIFDFLWGGRYEWVARGRMMSGLAEGGRDVPDLPLKLDTIFVASLLQDMASEVGHPASLGMKYFFLYAARGILNWSNVSPRSEQLPWHYAWVAKWLRAHPEALEDGIWKQQRVLYRVVRGKVNPSPVLGVPSSVWVGVQAVGLSNGQKDLNWACLHRTLPVRDKIHRHGLGRSPLCPRPSCGAGETAYHVMWECSFTRQLWAKAKKVVGRAKPDLTLTWQVVERGFVGAHIRSGWGILWLLLSLYKRGLWLARQELVRNGVEWSGLQRGWLRGSNGR
ncbi:hypothetical protein Q8A73_024119 [Channa argus]|nr:hypothetical protein Q8A73_024104 [Channa argus]KAK2875507.1 hypothetical protein Q8A73_024119 [Channa argus]